MNRHSWMWTGRSKPSNSRNRWMSCWLASAGSIRSTGSPLSRITQKTTSVMPTSTTAVCARRRPMYHHDTMNGNQLLCPELGGVEPLIGHDWLPNQAVRQPECGGLPVEEDEGGVLVKESLQRAAELVAPARVHRGLVGGDPHVGLRGLVVVAAWLRVQEDLEDTPGDVVRAPPVEVHLELLCLVALRRGRRLDQVQLHADADLLQVADDGLAHVFQLHRTLVADGDGEGHVEPLRIARLGE